MKLTAEQLQRVQKTFNKEVYSNFVKVQSGYNSVKVAEEFKVEMMEKARNFADDELWDERQTALQIKRTAEETEQPYLEKIRNDVADLAEMKEVLERHLTKQHNTWYDVVKHEEKKLGTVDLSQMKTEVMLAESPKELLSLFRSYMTTAEDNEALSNVLYRNAHIFIERMNGFEVDHKTRGIFKSEIGKAKENGQTEVQKLSRAMLDALAVSEVSGAAGERLIQQFSDGMKKNYKNVLAHEESKVAGAGSAVTGNPEGIRDVC
ncbi:hypothetical protein [Bacillus wiedmannii]|uniref:hypothetical protein n=1 Tax=Bacillus wiedmannii TaxID=1890302 RepID=UPI0007CB04EF|nr:hypothetical protein [Bacillus wiedmannii]OAK32597.1 hypothetical protein A6284_28345 [Bacillus wiedmannii]HDR7642645.1 hypothetical protein [Bacillus wiedmannii]